MFQDLSILNEGDMLKLIKNRFENGVCTKPGFRDLTELELESLIENISPQSIETQENQKYLISFGKSNQERFYFKLDIVDNAISGDLNLSLFKSGVVNMYSTFIFDYWVIVIQRALTQFKLIKVQDFSPPKKTFRD